MCSSDLVKNILKYLRRTKDMFLVYGGENELIVNGYPMRDSKPTGMISSRNQVLCSL